MFFHAFITKAEFDSAISDFNARLTTFEAGINSKIDSQVTSYLDRNGIWNGKEIHLIPYENMKNDPNKVVIKADGTWYFNGRFNEVKFTQANFCANGRLSGTTQTGTTISPGEYTYTAIDKNGSPLTYTYTLARISRASYMRTYYKENCFKANKTGLLMYTIMITTAGTTNTMWYNKSPSGWSYTMPYNINLASDLKPGTYESNTTPYGSYIFGFFDMDKHTQYITSKRGVVAYLNDIPFYPWIKDATAWEFIPPYLVGTSSQMFPGSGYITLTGNFFVTSDVTYGMCIKPFYCWTAHACPAAASDDSIAWDTNSYANFYLAPSHDASSAVQPSLLIY